VASDGRVFVEAPGRLHFGVLDLRGSLGRWFGGIGAAAPVASVLVSASLSDSGDVTVDGDDGTRAKEFARRFLDHHSIAQGACINIHRGLPPHAGLGSGTQLALSVARALAELHGLNADVAELARAVGRTQRSGVGMWAFADGGFIVEGGRREENGTAPLLARIPFPQPWRCIVIVPPGAPGLSGERESSALRATPLPPAADEQRIAHLVLMALMPALIEADLQTFGAALRQIQEITGGWFAAAQGGTFARGATTQVIAQLDQLGAMGVGQSSWGPAVYGMTESEEAMQRLLAKIGPELGEGTAVFHGPFRTTGARVWRD
jgi:beta-ribofuranosylaminobenzene 5'-phosphate synthase